MIDHEYVTIKLSNGENIICVLVGEEDEYLVVMYPIVMKTTRVEIDNKPKEILTGSVWCPFTDDVIFDIYKNDIIFIKSTNESTTAYYKKFIDTSVIDQFMDNDLFNEFGINEQNSAEQIELIDELVDELNDIDEYFLIKGNNTIN